MPAILKPAFLSAALLPVRQGLRMGRFLPTASSTLLWNRPASTRLISSASFTTLSVQTQHRLTATQLPLFRSTTRTLTAAAPSPPSSEQPSKRSIRSLMKEYGPIAIVMYITMSSLTFLSLFAAITFLGIDEAKVKSAYSGLKARLGFHPLTNDEITEQEKEDAEEKAQREENVRGLKRWIADPTMVQVATNGLLAFALNKLFVPIKLALTAGFAPVVARRLRAMGFNLGGQWKDVAKTAQVKMDARRAARREADK